MTLAIATTKLLTNDTDVDGDTLTVISVQGAVGGTVSLSGGTVNFVPAAGFFGAGGFAYTVTDSGSPPLSDTGLVTVLVSRPPVAQDDLFSVPDIGPLVVAAPGVLGNDADPDGESLSAVLLSAPAYGTLSLHPLGGFSYVADRVFPGVDSFVYRARDAGGIFSGPATVTLAGTPHSGDESVTIDEDTPVVVEVLANDPGLDSNPPPETEVAYCYDGYDAECGGSDAPATAYAAGRLTRIKDKPGDVAFAFDGASRQVRETRTLSLPGESRTLVTERAFDENGNAVSTTLPTGVSIEREFDETNRETLVSVRAPGVGSAQPLIEVGDASTEGWFPQGGLRRWRAADGSTTFTIEQDASGWVTALTADGAAGLESIAYRYASDGNVIAIDSAVDNNVGHDSLGRITYDRGNFYSYDDAGNRVNGPGAIDPDPESNRWSSAAAEGGAIAYAFDAAGNVTQRGSLSLVTADDGTVIRLEGVGDGSGVARFTRDHRNLRVASTGVTGDERFVHAPSGDLELRIGERLAEGCGTGQVREVLPVEHYVYLGGRRVAMVAGRIEGACGGGAIAGVLPPSSAEERFLYFADKMDLARAVFRAGDGEAVWRAEFDAFGAPTGAGIDEDPDGDGVAFEQAFRLPGQEEIRGTELSENWNRVFDRVVGRYLEVDPLRRDLASYLYAANTPLSAFDSTGLDVEYWLIGNRAIVHVSNSLCPSANGNVEFDFDMPWVQTWPFGIRTRTSPYAAISKHVNSPVPPTIAPTGRFQSLCCAQDQAAEALGDTLWADPPIWLQGGSVFGIGMNGSDFGQALTNAASGTACNQPQPAPCQTPPPTRGPPGTP